MLGKNYLRVATKARSFDVMGFIWSRSQLCSFLKWKQDLALSSELHPFHCHLMLEMQTSAKTGIGSPHMISSLKDFRQPSSILVVRSSPHRGVKSRIVPWAFFDKWERRKWMYDKDQVHRSAIWGSIATIYYPHSFWCTPIPGVSTKPKKGGSLASKYNSVQWAAATSGA